MAQLTEEVKSMFKKVYTQLGAPIRAVQLTDEMMCELLDIAIEDYSEKINNWLIQNQWASIYGKNLSSKEMAFAISTRTFDMMKDYSNWFSKEVGLQQEGTKWELKKDFITIEKGKQNYIIPSGRTVNKVMWVNPPTSQAALFANYGGIDIGFGGGFAQLGGGAYGPVGGFYTAPAADVAYLSADIQFKNRLLRCDLTYKITAGPDGTHILHLMSTPGSRLSFGYMGGNAGGLGLVGCEVWYTYYDTNSTDEDECALAHNGQTVLTPDQVPLSKIDFSLLNDPTKALIRQLLTARAFYTLGIIRGTLSGKVSIPLAEMQMDYNMLITRGKEMEDKVWEDMKTRLENMTPVKQLEMQADIVAKTLEIQKGTPLGIYTI